MAATYHLSDFFTQHLAHYQQQQKLTQQQSFVCRHIQTCRDRHCPRCQGQQTRAWIVKQQAEVLNCRYFHLVFTLPHEPNILMHYEAKKLYSALFEAVWQTLSQFGMTRKHLQGKWGATVVLHTWGQTLTQHIHLHCLIPGGVLTAQGLWHAVQSDYLFPVKALSTVYRA